MFGCLCKENKVREFKTLYEAHWWLEEHPAFRNPADLKFFSVEEDPTIGLHEFTSTCLDIDVQLVNPETMSIVNDPTLNTLQQVWLEVILPVYEEDGTYEYMHDWKLDCGGDTFEDVMIKLAKLVLEYYGDY